MTLKTYTSKSANVELLSSMAVSPLLVAVSTADTMYGYLVAEI